MTPPRPAQQATPGGLRLLVVARREPWPLSHGGNLRLYHFLRHLVRRAAVTVVVPGPALHRVRLPAALAVVGVPEDDPPAHGVTARERGRQAPWAIARARRHFGYHPALWRWLAEHARPDRFDVALLAGDTTGVYCDALRVPMVWDAVDELVLYTWRDLTRRGPAAWAHGCLRALLYAAYERSVARHAAHTVLTAQLDAACLRRWAPTASIAAISNGVDLDHFQVATQASEPGTLAFVGNLSFPPNVEGIRHFVRRIWPRLLSASPARRLLIVGREPAPEVQALASVNGVRIHSDVPDVRPYLARASAVIVPTRLGGGVKNKILEACAVGRAVVASPQACGDLTARPGEELLRATTDRDWLAQLTFLLTNPAATERIGRNGRRWVQQTHAWAAMALALEQLLRSAADPGRTQADTAPEATLAAPVAADSDGCCYRPLTTTGPS